MIKSVTVEVIWSYKNGNIHNIHEQYKFVALCVGIYILLCPYALFSIVDIQILQT